jgi:hypothetical protein
MATQDLFNGHKYVFTKVSSSLVLDDATDNSHETITFREGMVVSASSGEYPITIKAPSNQTGLQLISYESGNDIVAKLEARSDDGFFGLYSNNSITNYLNSNGATMHYMKTSLATNSTSNIVHIEQSDGVDAFRIRGNKDIIVGQSSSHTGRIAFGTSSPTAIMQIYDGTTANYGYMHKYSTTSLSYVKCLGVQRASVEKFFVYSYGKIHAYSTSIASVSDSRLKEEIVDANSQWDDIKAIEWKNFKMKKDVVPDAPEEHKQLGVIAQQVETISPSLVDESPPTTNQIKQNPIFGTLYTAEDQEVIDGEKEVDDVKEVHHNVKDMNYSILWMKSCKALQEAMIRIEQLEAKVTALENN